ncbi:hypothetical protein F2P56_020420 [Juglans regia]|uniref:PPM-type phosphatase domain-containing protein n=2 Tax=Juglans regia TaxID=51240 RepID=A0A833X5Z9_JUGRE|nr:probable protein phosphatase 2C 8 [Juglans regia]KAF5460556.1 hypothetical protein F2P56_020420 [Juglans regia]
MDVSSSGTLSYSGGSSDDGAKPIEVPVSGGVGGGGEKGRSFARPSQSSISVIGRRRVMEDAVRVAPRFAAPGQYCDTYDFFAVYDGHNGDTVANACRDRLHLILVEEVERWWRTCGGRGVDWENAMVECFAKMDEEVNGGGTDDGAARTVGSTAVVVLVGKEEVVVANCGDSRAVLCRDGVAVPLSHDHKPDRPDERERVEAAGGRVIEWNGSRVLGVLATSRSIGDHYLRPYVISEPEVTVTERTESDDFIVIASDGLWDVISNELACKVGQICLNDGRVKRKFSYDLNGNCAADAAAVLAKLAMARGSKDNISVIVVQLRKSR